MGGYFSETKEHSETGKGIGDLETIGIIGRAGDAKFAGTFLDIKHKARARF